MLFVNKKLNQFKDYVAKKNHYTQFNGNLSQQLLINGDSMKLLKHIPSNSIDHVNIDVPYLTSPKSKKALEKSLNSGKDLGASKSFLRTNLNIMKMSHGFPVKYVLTELFRIEKHPNLCIWCSHQQVHAIKEFYYSKHIKGLRIKPILWYKTNGITTNTGSLLTKNCEICLSIYVTSHHLINGQSSYPKALVYTTQINNEDHVFHLQHPTIKYLFMTRNLIFNQSKLGDSVLDIYMGSGTSGIASKMLGRNYIGIELEPKYYKLAKHRVSKSIAYDQKVVDFEMGRIIDRTYYHNAIGSNNYIHNRISNAVTKKLKAVTSKIKQLKATAEKNNKSNTKSKHPAKAQKKVTVKSKAPTKPKTKVSSKSKLAQAQHQAKKVLPKKCRIIHSWKQGAQSKITVKADMPIQERNQQLMQALKQGLTYKQLAEVFHMTRVNVAVTIHRIRARKNNRKEA